MVDSGYGVGPLKNSVYLDFADAITRLGEHVIGERYGNLFDMYERITDENPYKVPMRIYPAIHYTMGGLWVDYNLMTTIPGLYAIGEANFADQGANRLGASALMQGLADGYFVLPYTIGNYLAGLLGTHAGARPTTPSSPAAEAELRDDDRPVAVGGRHQVGRPLPPRAGQDRVGLLRHGPRQGRPGEGPGRDPRPARRVRARTSGCWARPTRSTSRSRRCSGWPTSSSWPS